MGMAEGMRLTHSRSVSTQQQPPQKVALWLQPRPNSPLYRVLENTIAMLAPVFDDAPRFTPHITLCSQIYISTQQDVDYILDTALAAAQAVQHLEVKLEDVNFGKTFCQKVYFDVARSAELVSLAAITYEQFIAKVSSSSSANESSAQEKAAQWAKAEFKPHLSLVYSSAFPVSEALRHTVHQRLVDVFGNEFNKRGMGWLGGQLSLVNCEGSVEDWRVLGTRIIE